VDLVVGGNQCLAGDASIAKQLLVALLAVRLIVSQDVPLTYQAAATATTAELATTPVLLQRLRKVGGKQQL